jgi:DNA repair exonuclease SbcCD nuclease subunit
MADENTRIIHLGLKEDEAISFVGDIHANSVAPSSRTDNYSQTVCDKLTDIRNKCIERNVKAVIFLGDIFHKVQSTNEIVNRVGMEFLMFKESGMRLFSVVGNHDISRNNLDAFLKSPLSILFNFGVVEHINLNNRIILNKMTLITPLDYTEQPVMAHAKAKCNYLVAHMFYGNTHASGSGHNLDEKDIRQLGYDAVILGHDHVKYPVLSVDSTDIIRPGSVTRGTTHDYNFQQTPSFYVLKEPWQYRKTNLECVAIKHLPMEEVVSSTVVNKKFNLGDLSTLMSSLVDKLSEENTEGYDTILETVKNDKNLTEDIKQTLLAYFSDCGILC